MNHKKIKYPTSTLSGGRLTDRHKNKINTEETLNRLNQIAKEKVNESSNKTNN